MHAGAPSPASEVDGKYFDLFKLLGEHEDETLPMRVAGPSMIECPRFHGSRKLALSATSCARALLVLYLMSGVLLNQGIRPQRPTASSLL